MNETENNQQKNLLHEKNHHELRPYWKRAHLHWGFWVGVLLMTLALLVYIFSIDLSQLPRIRHHQTPPASTAR